jgi:hypothetical protein
VALGLGLAAAACGAPGVSGTRVLMPSYLLGTLGTHMLDVRGLCPGRTAEIELVSTPGTVAATILTLGIYTPHELRLTCAGSAPGTHPAKGR